MMKTAIYPGTFDPLTNGHVDIVERAARLFDNVIIAVAESAGKQPQFALDDRAAMCREVFSKLANVKVETFNGLLVDFVKRQKDGVIVRGLRSAADFEFEAQLASMNQTMCPTVETVFLTASPTTAHIASSQLREIAAMGGDVSLFVPPAVAAFLKS